MRWPYTDREVEINHIQFDTSVRNYNKHFETPPLVSLQNDNKGVSADIPY